jgi:hypothetical protein
VSKIWPGMPGHYKAIRSWRPGMPNHFARIFSVLGEMSKLPQVPAQIRETFF